MQNVVLLGRVAGLGAIDGLTSERMERALVASVPEATREPNLVVFRRAVAGAFGHQASG